MPTDGKYRLQKSLCPDGRYLVTTGLTLIESSTGPEEQGASVFVIDTDHDEVVGRFEPPGLWPEIDFSPDGRYLYIGESIEGADGRIAIVDLATMELTGTAQGTLIGGAGLLMTGMP